jgi:hypothetical protein
VRSRDAATREIAESVAAGEAGPAALADTSTLRHHRLNTAAAAPRDARVDTVERFHHR